MYKVNILDNDGRLEIELTEGEAPSGRDHNIVHTEELDNIMAAKKRYHMLKTFDDDMLRSIIKHGPDSGDDGDNLSDLDRILGRGKKENVTMHKI